MRRRFRDETRAYVTSCPGAARTRLRTRACPRGLLAMVSSSSSGDLFMLNARNTGRAQGVRCCLCAGVKRPKLMPRQTADDDDDELAIRRQVPHSRAGRPAKRPRDDLAQALREDSDAGPQQAPMRKSGGSVPPPAPAPASPTDEVDAWARSCVPALVVRRPTDCSLLGTVNPSSRLRCPRRWRRPGQPR